MPPWRGTRRRMPPAPERSRRADLATAAVIATALAVHLIVVITRRFQLAPDEALFWDWARHPQLGYAEKPPLVAWVIAATRAIAGDTEAGVRLAAPWLTAFTVSCVAYLTRAMYSSRHALLAACTLLAMPLMNAGAVLITPDTPMGAAWAATLVLSWRASQRGGIARWAAAGVTLGLALLAKYTAAALLVGIVAHAFMTRRERPGRSWTGRWWLGPLVAGAVSVAVLSPALWWNAQNGWISFAHVASQGRVGQAARLRPDLFARFLGGESLVVSPILFVLVITGLVAAAASAWRGDARQRFLMSFALPLLLTYVAVSFRVKALENWPGAAWLASAAAISPLMAGLWERRGRRAIVVAAFALGVAMTALGFFPDAVYRAGLPRPDRIDPAARLRGWRETGALLERVHAERGGADVIAGATEQITAEMAFYGPGRPEVACLDTGRRRNQYDLWGRLEGLEGRDLLVVADAAKLDRVAALFDGVEVIAYQPVVQGGVTLRTMVVVAGHGYRGRTTLTPAVPY